jgi:hypothetical protein
MKVLGVIGVEQLSLLLTQEYHLYRKSKGNCCTVQLLRSAGIGRGGIVGKDREVIPHGSQ